MTSRRFAGILATLVLAACSQDFALSLSSMQDTVARANGEADFLLRVEGAERDPVSIDEIEIRSIPYAEAQLVSQGANVYLVHFAAVSASTDSAADFEVAAQVRGVRAQASVAFAGGDVSSVVVHYSGSGVSADEATAAVGIEILDAGGHGADPDGLSLSVSQGYVAQLVRLSEGIYQAELAGLIRAGQDVEVLVQADDVSASTSIAVLVGELAGFDIAVNTRPLQANEPVQLQIRAVDLNGNFRSAYDGVVAWDLIDEFGFPVPIFPLKSNSFEAGELIQQVFFTAQALEATLRVEDTESGVSTSVPVGQILPQPVRCMELRREGLKSRIFTADEGGDPDGAVFNAFLYSISCEEKQQLEDEGTNVLAYTIQGVDPLVRLLDTSGAIVGRSDVAGHDADDLVGDLRSSGLGYVEIPVYDLTRVEGSPFQLIATVGQIAAQVQIEITPGEWDSIGIDPIPDIAVNVAGVPLPYAVYASARDAWGNIVFTETASVTCDYVNEPVAAPTGVTSIAMTLGQVTLLMPIRSADVVSPAAETLQCWDGATYLSSSHQGERSLTVRSSLTVNPADVVGSGYIERFEVILPGQTFVDGNPPQIVGDPDPQVAGVPFEIAIVAVGGTAGVVSNPSFDGSVYLSPLLGGLVTYDGDDAALPVSPLSQGFETPPNEAPYLDWSVVRQRVSLDTAGPQTILVNQTLRSNIAYLDPTLPPATSDIFEVRSSIFDHFEISPIASPQAVGSTFLLSVRAVDAAGNVVNGYNSSAEISDLSGYLSADTGTFENGVLELLVSVGAARLGNQIRVETGDGEFTVSNAFDVTTEGFVSSFMIYASSGAVTECASVVPGDALPAAPALPARTAAQPFAVRILARGPDGKVADFSWPASITDSSGSLNRSATDSFYRGCLVQSGLVIPQTGSTRLTVAFNQAGNAASYQSGPFAVNPGPPARVEFTLVDAPPAPRGEAFDLHYQVVDAAGNLVSAFNEPLVIDDTAGILVGGAFTHPTVAGEGDVSVYFSAITDAERITADYVGVTYNQFSGQSEEFNVIVIPAYFTVSVPASVDTYVPFSVTIDAYDDNDDLVTDFALPVSIELVGTGAGVISPLASPAFSGGSAVFDVELHADTKPGTRAIRAYFAGPTGTVDGLSSNFTVDLTAFVDVGSIPIFLDLAAFPTANVTVPMQVYSSDNSPMLSFDNTVGLGFYLANANNRNNGCSTTLAPQVAVSPATSNDFVAGVLSQNVAVTLVNPLTVFLPIYGCVGARLPDSTVVHFSSVTCLEGPNNVDGTPPFGANCQ